MKLFYIATPIAALASVWLLNWGDATGDILAKLVASAFLLVVCFVLMTALGWRRERNRQQKIKGAVLSSNSAKRYVLPTEDK